MKNSLLACANSIIDLVSYYYWKTKTHIKDYYISEVSPSSPWVYCCYIAGVFYLKPDDISLDTHQNKREAIEMVKIWNALGYNVYAQDFNSSRPLPRLKNVDLVFGIEPLFEKAVGKYHPHKSVYYATGCYCDHQTRQVRYMTDAFNAKYGADIPYRRESIYHKSYKIADNILLIGCSNTKKTFPIEYQEKISLIHQSTQSEDSTQIRYSSDNSFFFMASSGNMLRGVPILLDYFIRNTQYSLYVVGPIEDDVMDVMQRHLTDNIHIMGFLNVRSEKFLSLVSKCNFFIYPSGSEGGVPGSVLNSMKQGLIPIVSKWSSFDGIDEFAYEMKTWDEKGIADGVEWANSLSAEEVLRRKIKSSEFVRDNFSIENFRNEFRSYFSCLLQGNSK